MLSKIKRRFHAVKYLFSIQFVSLEPWPLDDKPVSVYWRRGTKKSKHGKTEPKFPEEGGKAATVSINEGIQLSATLYASSSKQKQTGPYQKKEVQLHIMQMTEDGEVFTLLGNATINLADIAGPGETTLEIPIKCDSEIVRAVGKPKLVATCRGWYKGSGGPGSMSSVSSAMSAMSDLTEEAGTHSDLSSMSSEAVSHNPKKKLGTLTTEQASSLEGFDGRSGQLDSIMEVLSPRPDSDNLNDSANSITAEEEKAKETAEPEATPGNASPHTPQRLDTISEDEETPKKISAPIADVVVATNMEDGEVSKEPAKKASDHQDDVACSLEDLWTGMGGKKVRSSEALMGNAIAEWWGNMFSLMTCIPQPPKED